MITFLPKEDVPSNNARTLDTTGDTTFMEANIEVPVLPLKAQHILTFKLLIFSLANQANHNQAIQFHLAQDKWILQLTTVLPDA